MQSRRRRKQRSATCTTRSRDARGTGRATWTARTPRLRIWRVALGRTLRPLSASGRHEYTNARYSPDGTLLLVNAGDSLAFVDPARGTEVGTLPLANTNALGFGQSGALLTNGEEGGLLRWPVQARPESNALIVGPPR